MARMSKALRARPLIMGENMNRVRRYAGEVGGKVYEPRGWVTRALNTRMINYYKSRGRKIIDIGPDFRTRATVNGKGRPLYELERRLTKDYPGYERVWVRTGKRTGGMRDWGEF